ncbi:hypothetical protein G9A89_016512 [Geosiphon pyriformis]|nr:hypothetical protein G9A89_016512 [Geosiphon pyriformis]
MKLKKSFRNTLVEAVSAYFTLFTQMAEYWTKVEKPSLLTYLTYLKEHQVSTKTLRKRRSYNQYVTEINTILQRRHFSSDHLRAMANVTSACNDAPSAILVWLLMGILNVRMDICRPICHRPLSRVGSDHLGATANVASAWCYQILNTIKVIVDKGAVHYQSAIRKNVNQTKSEKIKMIKPMFHSPMKVPIGKNPDGRKDGKVQFNLGMILHDECNFSVLLASKSGWKAYLEAEMFLVSIERYIKNNNKYQAIRLLGMKHMTIFEPRE